MILDLGLPDMDGSDVIRGLRGWSTVPIIVLSGRAEGTDKVGALDAGADDYITKPFGVDELLARIRAVTRRAHPQDAAASTMTLGRYTIDLSDRTITPADFRLLLPLVLALALVLPQDKPSGQSSRMKAS